MNIVEQLRKEYQRKQLLAALLVIVCVSISIGILSGLFVDLSVTQQVITGLFIFVLSVTIWGFTGGFRKPSDKEVIRFLDRNYSFLEESSSLLINEPESLLEEWQKKKIILAAEQHSQDMKTTNRLIKKSSVLSFLILMVVGVAYIIQPHWKESRVVLQEIQPDIKHVEEFRKSLPAIENAQLKITPPQYTNLPQRTENPGNIRIAEGSEVEWTFNTTGETEKVTLLFADRTQTPLERNGDRFKTAAEFSDNHIYQVVLSNRDTTVTSEFYGISVRPDQPPVFRFTKPDEHRTIVSDGNTSVDVEFRVIDDFGVTDLSLHTTLARGSGENVRFSEQQLSFDHMSGLGTTEVSASAVIHPNSIDMQPGDELYFHVQATDNHPHPQTARSETFFIIFSDTTRSNDAPFGSVVVDLMPEYLRSQRQIIIDTEQLLEDESSISVGVFRSRSETIGRDQNLLRMRYGFYLGQEDEGDGSGVASDLPVDDHSNHNHTSEHDHDHDHSSVDQNDGLNHDEDLDHQGLAGQQSQAAELIPHEFFHDHGSADLNTLYAESPRAMLQQALGNMWNAEVYLRTGRPAEALPFEYAALELLQAAQQSERRYLRKTAHEIPPIPESEKRLTGEYDDFASPSQERRADAQKPPLVKLQQAIREGVLVSAEKIEDAELWINEADIGDSDRLFLLNRLLDLDTDGGSDSIRQEMLQRISEISPVLMRDPTPLRRPSLKKSER